MIGLVDRALALNPSFAHGWYLSGFLRVFAAQHDLAIEPMSSAPLESTRVHGSTPNCDGQGLFLQTKV